MRSLANKQLLLSRSPIQEGEQAVVVGAGASGEAAARLLVFMGVKVRLVERNEKNISPEFAGEAERSGIEIATGEHSAEQFRDAALVVTSPGIPLAALAPHLEAAGGPPLMGEMELAGRLTEEPILAVTGTSGKTTTVSLAKAMLEAAGRTVFLGGNIGTPLSTHILTGSKKDVLVLEASSFQLQTCSTFKPHVAVLLNLSPNHLDHHADMREYTEAKFQIFACQTALDVAVLPPDLADTLRGRGYEGLIREFRPRKRFEKMRLFGPHNEANIEAAFTAVQIFGVTAEYAAKAVAAFAPIEHRLELVDKKGGILFINDSKSTTVDSLRVALESFREPVILLAGGKFKGGDLASLRPLLEEKAKAVRLFGASREVFEAAWGETVPLDWHPDMDGAFQSALETAQPGDVVLLSPATASFDLYKNYKERGKDFTRLVKGR